ALDPGEACASPQALSGRARRERPQAVGDKSQSDERETEDRHLERGESVRGIDELGQEREEEESRLWVEDVGHETLAEVAGEARRSADRRPWARLAGQQAAKSE